MKKLIIVCVTVVLLSGIGSWLYVQKQDIKQKNQEFAMQQIINKQNNVLSIKKLKYQECETTDRQATANPGVFANLFAVQNCNLIL